MPIKPSKSNDALGFIGSVRSNPIFATAPTVGEQRHVSYKSLRYSARGTQIVLAIVGFLSFVSQDHSILAKLGMFPTNIILATLTFLLPFLSTFLVVMYVAAWAGRWTVKKILTIETISDSVVSLILTALAIAMINANAKGQCGNIGESLCDRFNWAISMSVFYAASWIVSLFTDLFTIRKRYVGADASLQLRRLRAQT